jgi:drug/metabolite transporter (DMT)-like permease
MSSVAQEVVVLVTIIGLRLIIKDNRKAAVAASSTHHFTCAFHLNIILYITRTASRLIRLDLRPCRRLYKYQTCDQHPESLNFSQHSRPNTAFSFHITSKHGWSRSVASRKCRCKYRRLTKTESSLMWCQIGIFVGLLSTGIQSIGLTLQRKSHLLEDSKELEDDRRPAWRRRRWQLGMLMFVVSNLVGSTIQITTLPLPVLSTLQASGLVFNTICAALILGEPFTRWSLAGTILVAGGAVLIAAYGALPEPSHSLNQLLYLLGRTQFILWMVGTLLVVVLALVGALLLSRLHNAHTHRMRVLRGMCFGFSSGILAAHSLLVAKSAVELLVRTIADHHNQFDRWQSWIILLSLVFFALSQLYFLHRGLKLCSTSVLYPFVFCIYNIVAIMDGLIYFQQASRLPALHAGLIAVGTVILLAGVIALSWRNDDDSPMPHPDAHTLLTPGMSLLEDTTTESESEDDDDDTSTLGGDDNTAQSEITPLLPTSIESSAPTAYNTLNSKQPIPFSIPANRKRLLSLPLDSPVLTSATDSAIDDTTPPAGIHRASTVAGDTSMGVGFFGATDTIGRRRKWTSRYRSASLPIAPELKKRKKSKRGKTPRTADVEAIGGAEEHREGYFETSVDKSWSGWFKKLFQRGDKS